MKYSYKITIGTQRVNSPVKLLYVPIRVLPLYEEFFNEAVGLCNDTTEELTPANPFMEIRQKESPLNLALQSLQVSYIRAILFTLYLNLDIPHFYSHQYIFSSISYKY